MRETLHKKSIELLLLNSSAVADFGLIHGRAGAVLCLFETAKYLNNESLEERAFDLLQECLAVKTNDLSFIKGKCGIAFALQYLIKNEFIEADYLELYQNEHNAIMKYIEDNASKKYLDEQIAHLLFINKVSDYVSTLNRRKIQQVIFKTITAYFEQVSGKPQLRHEFYRIAALFLSCCNLINFQKTEISTVINLINSNTKKIDRKDYVCDNPVFLLQLCIYGIKNNRNDIITKSEQILNICLKNLKPEVHGFNVLIDTVFGLMQIQSVTGNSFCKEFIDSFRKIIFGSDAEQLIINNFYNLPVSTGINSVLSKWLFLYIMNDKIDNRFSELFI